MGRALERVHEAPFARALLEELHAELRLELGAPALVTLLALDFRHFLQDLQQIRAVLARKRHQLVPHLVFRQDLDHLVVHSGGH